MAATSVNPDKILRELRELWVDLGKQQEVPGGVLRACSMTLLTVADSLPPALVTAEAPHMDDVESVHRMIGLLMHNHPSRAIVLSPREDADLSARVFSECWMPYHSRQQICAEGIEITADPEQMDDVARLLMALVVPDLPVVLWCRGPRAFRDRTLDPLFPLAHKIVFDTGAARNARTAMEFLRRLHKEGRSVADLAWTRLTGWRETIAAMFDDGCGDPRRFAAVQVMHGGSRPNSETLYLARWIDRSCPSANVNIEAVAGEEGLRAVVFNNPADEVSIHRLDGALEIRARGRTYLSPLPSVLDETVMREELSLLDRDPIFDEVLK